MHFLKRKRKPPTNTRNVIQNMQKKINILTRIYNSLKLQLKNARQIIRANGLSKTKMKIEQEMHRTHEEILVKYEKEQINKDQTYKTIAKKWKNINKALNEKTVGDGLLEILNNIDKDKEKSTDEKLKKEDFNFPFGDDIDNLKMAEFLEKITEFINDNYEKCVKNALSDFFRNPKIVKNIRLITDDDGIISILKKDMIISLLLEKNKNNLTSLCSPILCNKISHIPLNEIIINEKNNKLIFNKEFLKKAIKTKITSNIYEKVCIEYISGFNKNNSYIKKILCKHIDKMNIYFGELPEDVCGLTLYTGDVIINGKYLNLIYLENINNDLCRRQAICSIFLTLLHELAHILVRLFKSKLKNKSSKNQFIESEDISPISEPSLELKNYKIQNLSNIFIWKKNKIANQFNALIDKYKKKLRKKNVIINQKRKGMNEYGKFFDYNLFGIDSYFDLTEDESDFFLNLNNFNVSFAKYYKSLKNVYNLRQSHIKGYPFKSNINNKYAFPIGKCNLSLRS